MESTSSELLETWVQKESSRIVSLVKIAAYWLKIIFFGRSVWLYSATIFWEIEMVRHIMIVVWSAHRKKKWMRFVCYCTLLVYHKNALLHTKSLFMRLPWKFYVSWRKFQTWYNSFSFDARNVWQWSDVPNGDKIQVSLTHVRTSKILVTSKISLVRTCMLLNFLKGLPLKKPYGMTRLQYNSELGSDSAPN